MEHALKTTLIQAKYQNTWLLCEPNLNSLRPNEHSHVVGIGKVCGTHEPPALDDFEEMSDVFGTGYRKYSCCYGRILEGMLMMVLFTTSKLEGAQNYNDAYNLIDLGWFIMFES